MLEPGLNSSAVAIETLRDSSALQALVQLVLSSLSALLLCLYLSTYAIASTRMWRYPLSLAFWIYVCDLLVAIQFVLVSSAALRYTHSYENERWPITSSAGCLCDLTGGRHPGCLCQGGVLAFMLQAGLIGSTAFYACLSHNLFRSVADPFTRPSSRLSTYHVIAWSATLGLSVCYLIPQQGPTDHWTGFGYHYHYQVSLDQHIW